MTTLAHISANLRRLKGVPGWSSLHENPISAGHRGSHANAQATQAKMLLQNAAPGKMTLDARNEAEELALATPVHSDPISIMLPKVSHACLKGKTLPRRATGRGFFNAIALTDAFCALIADVYGKGASAAIVAAMLQGIICAVWRPFLNIFRSFKETWNTVMIGRYSNCSTEVENPSWPVRARSNQFENGVNYGARGQNGGTE